MEIGRQVIRLNESLFEGLGENTTECEAIIPDYFQEVYKVVRAEATPRVRDRRIENDRLVVEGVVEFRILYLPEDGKTLRSFSHAEDFQQVFVVGNMRPGCHVRVRTKVEYVGCRLLNPRKAYLKAVLSIAVKVWAQRELEAVKYSETETTHMQKKDVLVFDLISTAHKSFRISEDLDLYKGETGDGYVIKSEVGILFEDAKLISNKVIAKGAATLRTLFCSGPDNPPEVAEHSIPFSQIIDLEGVDETCDCEISFEVTEVKTLLKDNITGSSCIMQVEVGCSAYARAFKNQWVTLSQDAFDTTCEVTLESKSVTLERYLEKVEGVAMVKDTVPSAEPIESILDVSAFPEISGVAYDGKELTISGTVETLLLGVSAQGDIVNLEKSVPFSHTAALSSPAEHIRCEPDASLSSASYVIAGDNSVDLRIQLDVEALVFASSTEPVLTNITAGEEKQVEKENLPVLTLYYASKGERVWDIAKRFNASPSSIRSANKIADDDTVEEGKMLLLPRKRRVRK